jgi:multidrug efflux pump subunit AcrA (membrane-fusion protein)
LVDSSQVELRLNVSPRAAVGLKSGATLQASFDDGDTSRTASGRVSFVSPMADAASGLIEVRAVFDNKRAELRPGSKAVVRHLPIQAAR